MAGVMVMLALMLIFSTVIFQSWDEVLRRDNEAEMIFRAEEYSRAILRYRKAHSAPPVKLEQLLEPGPRAQYFLRRLYTDPLVKDGRWGLLYVGGNGEIVDPNGLHIGANAGLQGNVDQARVEQALRDAAGGIDVRRSAQSGTGQMALESEVAGGRQFAGLTIAGVKTLCTDEPFRVIDGQLDYADWKFTFMDLLQPKIPGQGKRGQRGGQAPGIGGPGNNPQRPGLGGGGRGNRGGNRRGSRR
jgi:hypothetical protein